MQVALTKANIKATSALTALNAVIVKIHESNRFVEKPKNKRSSTF